MPRTRDFTFYGRRHVQEREGGREAVGFTLVRGTGIQQPPGHEERIREIERRVEAEMERLGIRTGHANAPQPTACPICGAAMPSLAELRRHGKASHSLSQRRKRRAG